jgi:glycosyltransferase involved in cell wall biosynthesis
LPALYRRASIFVAPFIRDDSGNQEGLPVVLMEAIGCGCPVIVGEVAGVRDLLGDAANEVCVDPRDAQAFASAILATLGDPAGAQERARMIRLAAAGRVDWQVIADGYASLLESCVRDVVAKDARA